MMISDSSERRIPRRRDRFILVLLKMIFIVIVFSVPFLGIEIPIIMEYVSRFYIFVILLLVFGANLFLFLSWQYSWRVFAEDKGLVYETPKTKKTLLFHWPRITGVYQGYPVQMERFTRGTGKYKKIYTAITFILNDSFEEGLEISPNSWLFAAKRSMVKGDGELQYMSLNDDVFDKKLEIKSTDEQFARSVLSSNTIRQELREIRSQASDIKIKIEGRKLYYHERSNIIDRAYLSTVFNTLRELVRSVERYGRFV